MSERNYLKTEAVFLAEKTPKKEVVITPPLREDSLEVTENGTYQAPIGRGYTDVSVNVEPEISSLTVTLTKNPNDEFYTADKTNAEIVEAIMNNAIITVAYGDTVSLVNFVRIIDPVTGSSRFRATVPVLGEMSTYSDDYDNTTWWFNEYKLIYWVNLTWDDNENGYVADKTNSEILSAIRNGVIPYISFALQNYPAYANFVFVSPIILTAIDETNELSLFRSQLYINGVMMTLYSDQSLPVLTNTKWYTEGNTLANRVYVDEWVYYPINFTQQTSNSSNSFECSEEANDIIFYCANSFSGTDNGNYRIPYIRIHYFNDSKICTRNLEVCNDGTLHIIYYDPIKNQMCKLTHLPTDGTTVWSRSLL